jgi:WD40 repeat protein
MAWPLSQDYNEAIQSPRISFSDPELRQGQVVVNALGIPQPCSGNFADVYAVECPATQTKWAVKCFTREVRGLRERYSEISKYLQQVNLPFTVDFQYLEQGIRVAGRWYPVLKMHWVEGFTLNAFVRDMLDKPNMLEALARIWVRMAHRLREAKLGHCDLQHGNVLLVPGVSANALALKLIDYDGMWVPALARSPSGEVGHPAYQHPQRLRESTYSPESDRFSLLVIATALRGLSVGGRALWERYNTGDNMLFRQQDFEAPSKSPLLADLLRLNNPEVRDLVVKLIDAARMPLEQVPHLADLYPIEAPVMTSPRATVTPARMAVASAPKNIINVRSRRAARRNKRSWGCVLVAGAAVLAVSLGGALFWAMSSANLFDEATPTTNRLQARAVPGEPPEPPVEPKPPPVVKEEEPKEPAPAEKPKAEDVPPPDKPKPEEPIPPPEKPKPEDTPPPPTTPKPEDTPPPPPKPKPEDTPPPAKPKPVDKPPPRPVVRVPLPEGVPGVVRRFPVPVAQINGVAFSPDGRLALAGGEDGIARLWDVQTGQLVRQCKGHQGAIQSVAFSLDGRRILTGGKDKTARVWDTGTGSELARFQGHTDWVRSVAFSPDGQRALTTCGGQSTNDYTVRLWDAANGKEMHVLRGHDRPVACAVFTPDGLRAVSGGDDNTVRLWDLADGRELRKFTGHANFIYSVVVSNDGRVAASAAFDKTIRLWDLDSGAELRRLEGHTDQVMSVAFSPDGRRLLSGSLDRTMRLWDRAGGRELARFDAENVDVRCVEISADDRFALAGSADKQVRLWRMPIGRLDPSRPLHIKAEPPPTPVADKLAVPDEDTLKKATEEIRDTYKAGFASKDAGELTNLADQLFQRGQNNSEPPERRYAFFVESSVVAARAGDLGRSLRALSELGQRFTVALLPLKATVLQQAVKEARTRTANEAILGISLFTLNQAIETDDYDAAERLVNTAEAAARKTGMPIRALQPYSAAVKRLKPKYAAIEPMVARLEKDAKDAEANRVVGSFRCFDKDDWEHGLPLLALGDNANLKALAQKDLAAPKASTERAAVGDGWWMQGRSQQGIVKYHTRQRACYWYALAMPDAVEKDRKRMEQGIRTFTKEFGSTQAWVNLKITPPMYKDAALVLSGDHKVLETRQAYSGPIEITALARTAKNSIRLRWIKGSAVIFNWENNPEELRVHRPDGAADRLESGNVATAEVKPLAPETWHLLRWRITEQGMTVAVDDKEVFREDHRNDLSARGPASINAEDSDVEVLSFTVKPLLKKPG